VTEDDNGPSFFVLPRKYVGPEYIPTGQMLAVRPAIVRFRDQGLKIIDWRRLQAPPVTNNCYGEKHRAENYMDLFMTGLISL